MGLDLAGNRLALTVQSNAVTDPNDRAAILTEFSVILAAIFWGTNFAATKFAALSIPPLLLVAFRFCAGGLLIQRPAASRAREQAWGQGPLPHGRFGVPRGGHGPDRIHLRPEHDERCKHRLDLLHGSRVGHALRLSARA